MENFEQPMDLSSGGGDSNAIILPNKRKRKRKGTTQEEKEKALLLSKSIDALGFRRVHILFCSHQKILARLLL
ncbi:hypothetical protein ABKV19_003561 [Rosa sericea]